MAALSRLEAQLIPVADTVVVNVCVEASEDWLFGDLREGFSRNVPSGITVKATDTPTNDADAWVFIRTHEAACSPNLARTVICIHDLYQSDGRYGAGGDRCVVRQAGGLALCHPAQRQILAEQGVSLDGIAILERPLGALAAFSVREKLAREFTVGWVGRYHARKRCEWFPQALAAVDGEWGSMRAVLLGKDLGGIQNTIRASGMHCEYYDRLDNPIERYPAIYRTLDCIVITSSTEAGPLPLFEALATGLPVISTPVGWAPFFARQWPEFVLLADTPGAIAAHLDAVRARRSEYFARRAEIARIVEPYKLDNWFVEVLILAKSLVF